MDAARGTHGQCLTTLIVRAAVWLLFMVMQQTAGHENVNEAVSGYIIEFWVSSECSSFLDSTGAEI